MRHKALASVSISTRVEHAQDTRGIKRSMDSPERYSVATLATGLAEQTCTTTVMEAGTASQICPVKRFLDSGEVLVTPGSLVSTTRL